MKGQSRSNMGSIRREGQEEEDLTSDFQEEEEEERGRMTQCFWRAWLVKVDFGH